MAASFLLKTNYFHLSNQKDLLVFPKCEILEFFNIIDYNVYIYRRQR